VCPGSQRAQPCPGLSQALHPQPVGAGDCPTLRCTGAAPPPALGADLGASIHEGHQTLGMCPEERDRDGEGL